MMAPEMTSIGTRIAGIMTPRLGDDEELEGCCAEGTALPDVETPAKVSVWLVESERHGVSMTLES